MRPLLRQGLRPRINLPLQHIRERRLVARAPEPPLLAGRHGHGHGHQVAAAGAAMGDKLARVARRRGRGGDGAVGEDVDAFAGGFALEAGGYGW